MELPGCTIAGDWDQLFSSEARLALERALPSFLRNQRWFAGKARTILGTQLVDVLMIPGPPHAAPMRWLLVRVLYEQGEPDLYQIPVVFAHPEQVRTILGQLPSGGMLRIVSSNGEPEAVLCDASAEPAFWIPLLELMVQRGTLTSRQGELRAEHTTALTELHWNGNTPSESATAASPLCLTSITVHGGEQSNTSIMVEGRFVFKIFRRVLPGENPDWEIGRFLTEQTELTCVPRMAGALVYQPSRTAASGDGPAAPWTRSLTIGVLSEWAAHQGDAWTVTLDELRRFIGRMTSESAIHDPEILLRPGASLVEIALETTPVKVTATIGPFLDAAGRLGRRTAELHQALSSIQAPAFRPEPLTESYQSSLSQSFGSHANRVYRLLRLQFGNLPAEVRELADTVLDREPAILGCFQRLSTAEIRAPRIRCHGDYHLGQILSTGSDFLIIDFEGEPARPLSERRIKASPLKDVAGMIRSFHYAAQAVQLDPALKFPRIKDCLAVWFTWVASSFLRAYLDEAQSGGFLPVDQRHLRILLDCYLLEKAIYELEYELNHRPDWVHIPLEGILSLVNG